MTMAKAGGAKAGGAKSGGAKPPTPGTILRLKITLARSKPPIWRRVLVPATMILGDLHVVIQVAMGWYNCHMHSFEIGGDHYGDRTVDDEVANENAINLRRLVKSGVTRFAYTYDFGADWEHIIAIEKSPAKTEGPPYPRCVAGKRACPPEDSGGVWSYQESLEILADPAHPEYAERREWFEEDIVPEEFDLAEVNVHMAAIFDPP